MGVLDVVAKPKKRTQAMAATPPRADAPRSAPADPYAFGDLTSETARRAYEEVLAMAGMGGQATRSMLPESVNQYIPDWLAKGGDYGLAGLTGLLGAAETGAGAVGEGVEAVQRGLGMDGRYAPGGSARALQSDLMGMLEGSGYAPEGRMLAGLADAAQPLARAGVMDFATGDFGGVGFKAYQGSPHNFAAERQVRYPDGRTEFISGQPDVLPDVPAGATVVRDYPLGRMRMDKIGTGEGAQAYGHGLYVADNENIAKWYRDQLTGGLDNWSVDGTPVTKLHGSLDPVDALKMNYGQAVREGKTPDEAIDWLAKQYRGKATSRFTEPENVVYFNEQIARLEEMRAAPPRVDHNFGSMYEVNINADPEAFLDWDKPLSEQPQAVRDALSGLDVPAGNMTAKDRAETIGAALSGDPRLAHLLRDKTINTTGDMVYKGMADALGSMDWPVGADAATRQQFRTQGAAKATEALREAGISGIRYLDAGSRSAGEGSRNYVVFDDSMMEILRKYGLLAPAVGAGAAGSPTSAQAAPGGLLEDRR